MVLSPESTRADELHNFVAGILGAVARRRGAGRVFGPDVVVRLRSGLRRIPDVAFLASSRSHLVEESALAGPPERITEVMSPESVSRDWREKFQEYQDSGVIK